VGPRPGFGRGGGAGPRGTCPFVRMGAQAQAAGAVGLVIVNGDNDAVRMVGDASALTLPVALLNANSGAGGDAFGCWGVPGCL